MMRKESHGMSSPTNTRITPITAEGKVTAMALLGTLGHLHTEPLAYDLACLRSLVQRLEPDLLGIEVEPEVWESGDLGAASVEIREALVPAAACIDTIIVPLGGSSKAELVAPGAGTLAGLRGWFLGAADRFLTDMQRSRATDGPDGVNSAAFEHICGMACNLEEIVAGDEGRAAWEQTNERILQRLLDAVRRDPGRRMLVAVNCRRVHWLRSRLRRFDDELSLVDYHQL